MVTNKSTAKEKASKSEEPQAQKTSSTEKPPVPQKGSTATSKSEKLAVPTPPLTMKQLHQEIGILKQVVSEHTQLIAQLQETLARKRKPVASNGKVKIKDKKTGTVYPSKNNAYQSLLKSGELKDLVDKGIFGPDPEKNTFGWYALVREWPDRFEEVAAAQNKQ